MQLLVAHLLRGCRRKHQAFQERASCFRLNNTQWVSGDDQALVQDLYRIGFARVLIGCTCSSKEGLLNCNQNRQIIVDTRHYERFVDMQLGQLSLHFGRCGCSEAVAQITEPRTASQLARCWAMSVKSLHFGMTYQHARTTCYSSLLTA